MRASGALRLLGAAVIAAALLGACDDGQAARAEEAARWLRAYTKTHPPNQMWRTTDVYGSDNGNVVMEVLVPSPKQAAAIKARRKIAQVLIRETAETLTEKHGIALEIDDSALTQIAELGFSPVFGARPLRNTISEHIRSVLADKLLRKELGRGNTVRVSYDGNMFRFSVIE
ncbi:MAG: hypothetical protein IIC54_07930 [Proteobacteria bacterium]|nr:hypothetical protein [Pseudomonadota bacterium]